MKKTVKQLDTFLRKKPRLGRGVYIAKTAVVIGDVTLGAHSSVWCGAVLRGDINRIVVGHHTNIQDNAVLHLADDFPCLVGNWVTVGHGAIVHACTVGDEVLVGMGAVILDGAVIGKQSVIGAKALVTQGMKIPPGSLVLGASAKVVRPLTKKGTRQTKMVGGKIRGQRSLLLEAQNQCQWAATELTSFIIVPPAELLRRFQAIHSKSEKKIQSYFLVTKSGRCWEWRGLNKADHDMIAFDRFNHSLRDFTQFLNLSGWDEIKKRL